MLIRSISDLGQLVRGERRHRHLSQTELATRAGVSRKWLADFERGKRSVDASLVLRTLAALGITLDAAPAGRSPTAPASTGSAPLDLDEHLARLEEPS